MGRASKPNAAGTHLRYLKATTDEDVNTLPGTQLLTLLETDTGLSLTDLVRRTEISPLTIRETVGALERLGMVDVDRSDSGLEKIVLTDSGVAAAHTPDD